MSIKITKTDFLNYLDCPEDLWMEKHQRDLTPAADLEQVFKMEQGNLIDVLARQLFEEGAVVEGRPVESGEVVFQREVQAGRFQAIADIYLDKGSEQHIYEVKASTQVKREHLIDVAFQRNVFVESGLSPQRYFIIHINKAYRLNGRIDIPKFFRFEEITDKVDAMAEKVRTQMEEAANFVNQPKIPVRMPVSSKKLDSVFLQHYFPNLPDYSVYQISRISRPKLRKLLDQNIVDIREVPPGFKLSEKQQSQVALAREGRPVIQRPAIRKILKELKFPLYFLDYEAIAYVIPLQKGFGAFQQMVFQYSLHIIEEPGAAIVHREYLLDRQEEAVSHLLEQLRKDIPEAGTVVVWNASFENTRNKEMARQFPEYATFLKGMIEQTFDLMTIFSKGLFADPRFKGSNSIKKILPVLVPDLSYRDLDIDKGILASIQWKEMTELPEGLESREKIRRDLLAYCKRDTLAMLRIYEELLKIV